MNFATKLTNAFCVVLIFSAVVYARPTSGFIDEVFSSVQAGPRPAGPTLIQRIRSLIKQSQWDDAINATHALQKVSDYWDYGYRYELLARIQKAKGLVKAKKFEAARTALEEGLVAYHKVPLRKPYSSLLSLNAEDLVAAELVSAQIELGLKRKKAALQIYETALSRITDRKKSLLIDPQTLENMAQLCAKERSANCLFFLNRVAKYYPDISPEREGIRRSISDSALARAETPTYRKKIISYPGKERSKDRDYEAIEEAMALYLAGKNSDALEAFQKFILDFPRSKYRARSLFWIGRAYEKAGEKEEAKKIFEMVITESPMTYYGILAAYKVGKRIEEYLDATLPRVARTDPALDPLEIERIARSEELLDLSLSEDASYEMEKFSSNFAKFSSSFLLYLATLHHRSGRQLDSFRILGEMFARGDKEILSSFGLRLIFPQEYSDLIKKYSDQQSVDPILVTSLMKQESAFERDILSYAGAAGLMQLMPTTALDLESKIQQRELFDPEANIKLGTRYIAGLVKKFDGNFALALAGYNAGPTRAQKWKNDANSKWDMLEFIEGISYPETREYVMSILRNYYWYHYLLKGERLASFDFVLPPWTKK